MRSHTLSALLLGGLAATLLAVPAASAAPSPKGLSALTLSPSRTVGVAAGGGVLGPFGLRNGTDADYDVEVTAVLLGQARSGAIVVREDIASRRLARRLLGVQTRRFSLNAGQARSVAGVVKPVAKREGIYAGMLFSARPRARKAAGARITNVLRLVASQYLAPREARPSFAPGAIRAEQAGPKKLRLQIPISNRGNVQGKLGGRVIVRASGGKVVLRAPVKETGVLPAAIVDVPAKLGGRLAAGHYTLVAKLKHRREEVRAVGVMDLVATNTVPTEAAIVTGFTAPKAIAGEKLEIKAGFRNTGNVPYAPGARVEVRAIDANGEALGAPIGSHPLTVASAAPGREGKISGSIALSDGKAFQLTLRLMDGDRELDARDARVDVVESPSLASRVHEFLLANALVLLIAASALMLAGAALGIAYVARLKARLRTIS
jgi:hypothetical protein